MGVGLNILTYFVEECSGSEAFMALFLGPAGQALRGSVGQCEWKDRASAVQCSS
jgi:hypothetical protein